MGIFKQKKHEQVDWKRIEGLIYRDRTIMSEKEWNHIQATKVAHGSAIGFDTSEWTGAGHVVCTMCQGTTPKGKPCEYCGRAT